MLTDQQKDLVLQTALENGFIKHARGKYFTASGNTTDLKRLFKYVNFPDALRKHKAELSDILIDFDLFRIPVVELLRDYIRPGTWKMPEASEDMAVEPISQIIKKLYPVVDLTGKGKEKIILVNSETSRPVYGLDIAIYLMVAGVSENEVITDSSAISVIPYFNPYTLETFVERVNKSLGAKLLHLNTYVPPEWRYKHAAPKYQGFVKTLIDHLFPIAEEREDVLDWLHYAITRRNGTILCLAGPRGTGKSLLMSILSYLVGEDYSEMVNKEILEEKFNSAFKNKRLIVFEEVEVSGNVAINRLKALANNRIVLEEKGQDSETIDNFTSMSILLNDISQLRIEAQDRRFSVPKVAERDLRTVIPEKNIQDFNDALMSEEISIEVAEFGEFLLARKPKRSYMYAIKGDYYYFLCSLAMSEWKNFLVEYIADKGEEGVSIPTKKISSAFKSRFNTEEGGRGLKFPDRASTFEVFLKDYKHRGDYFIGNLVKEVDENTGREVTAIMPNSEFLEYIDEHRVVSPKKVVSSEKDDYDIMAGAEAEYTNTGLEAL